MNNRLAKEIPFILLILIPFLYLAYIWNSLPEKVPLHWNINGEINGWGTKKSMINIPLLMPFMTYIIFLLAPVIDPKKKLMSMENKFYQLRLGIVLLMSILSLYILYSAYSQSLSSPNTLIILLGLLFTIIGNYFPSMKPNYFIGIRTPWTLENETVWKKTHQFAGKLWFPAGLLIIILCLIIKDHKLMNTIFLNIVGIIAIVPIVYSYLTFRKESQKDYKS